MSYINEIDGSCLFKNPEYKKIAKEIDLSSKGSARGSITNLRSEMGKDRDKDLITARVVQHTSNVAQSALKNPSISNKERTRLAGISKELKNGASLVWKEYRAAYK